jgi:type VI secretion system secreted protein Hcp
MATNWGDVWQSLSRRELFRKTGVATGVMLVLGALLDKASDQPMGLAHAQAPGLAIPNDYFLKIDGVEGESRDDKHRGEIDILSFSWGESQPGRGGAPKVQMEDMKFVMRLNKASTRLMHACATGQPIKGAILSVRKAGKDQPDYMKWTLTDVLVSSHKTGGSQGNPLITEEIALNFGRIDMEYKEQRPDGSLGGATHFGFDLKTNKAM